MREEAVQGLLILFLNALSWEHAGINDNDGVRIMEDDKDQCTHYFWKMNELHETMKDVRLKIEHFEVLLSEQNARIEKMITEVRRHNSEISDMVVKFMFLLFVAVAVSFYSLLR